MTDNTFHSLLQRKVSKTKPIVVSTNEIYQQDLLLKVIVRNRFAKAAITES